MDDKIGFVGGGALAGALLDGICGKLVPAGNIFVAERRKERREELKEEYGISPAESIAEFAEKLNIVILAVKPKDAATAMQEIAGSLPKDTLVISVVAGLKLESVEGVFPHNPVVRVMPNVPQAVGEGMAAYAPGKNADEISSEKVEKIWGSVGRVIPVEESLMDAVTGLSGSGPAFAFLVIDALADGGVAVGLPRSVAITLAAQTLLGSAKMVLDTGLHPDVLRDRVTSPGGTTIAGIRALEKAGLRSALIEAVIAATSVARLTALALLLLSGTMFDITGVGHIIGL